jgi:hypothetical protein
MFQSLFIVVYFSIGCLIFFKSMELFEKEYSNIYIPSHAYIILFVIIAFAWLPLLILGEIINLFN